MNDPKYSAIEVLEHLVSRIDSGRFYWEQKKAVWEMYIPPNKTELAKKKLQLKTINKFLNHFDYLQSPKRTWNKALKNKP